MSKAQAKRQLAEMIDRLVERRVKQLLPGLVAEVLSERYLKGLVEDVARPDTGRPMSLAEVAVPAPREVRAQPPVSEETADMFPARDRRFLASDNPFRELYEDVQGIPADSSVGLSDGVPVEKMMAAGVNFAAMARIASGRPASPEPQRMVEEHRRPFDPRLDTPVGGPTDRPAPRREVPPPFRQPSLMSSLGGDDGYFPEGPIVLPDPT